jgi:serine/threonine protein kinase
LKLSLDVFNKKERIQFENESKVMKQIDHPNLIKFYSCFWDKKKFCVVQKFVDGGSLQDKVEEHFTERKIIDILIPLLTGLQYLHSQKIIHKNLKFQNILFLKNGQLKISDFGFDNYSRNLLELNSSVTVTIFFMSSEMFSNGLHTTSSDIWSAGIIAYNLATHKFPFYSDNFENLKQIIFESEPKPLPIKFTSKFRDILWAC